MKKIELQNQPRVSSPGLAAASNSNPLAEVDFSSQPRPHLLISLFLVGLWVSVKTATFQLIGQKHQPFLSWRKDSWITKMSQVWNILPVLSTVYFCIPDFHINLFLCLSQLFLSKALIKLIANTHPTNQLIFILKFGHNLAHHVANINLSTMKLLF